jgi:hypothetical protein
LHSLPQNTASETPRFETLHVVFRVTICPAFAGSNRMVAGYKPAYEQTVQTMAIQCNRVIHAGGNLVLISFNATARFVVAFHTMMFTVKCGEDFL